MKSKRYSQHIILDFEMNPVSDKYIRLGIKNEIIEIGAVKLDSDFHIIDKINIYVKPQLNKSVTPFIRQLTGISQSDVYNQPCFAEAIKKFSEWIGFDGNTRIYAWSETDMKQFLTECRVKSHELPDNMKKRWLDFQALYPRIMKLHYSRRRHMALRDAAAHYGIFIDSKKAHNALYDAEITAQLLIPVLNGEYKNQISILHSTSFSADFGRNTLGDTCGGILQTLLNQMQLEMAV